MMEVMVGMGVGDVRGWIEMGILVYAEWSCGRDGGVGEAEMEYGDG